MAPEIRSYEEQVGPAGPTATQRATSNDFGGGVAEAMGQAGNSAQNLGAVLQQRSNQRDLSNLDVKMAKMKDQLGLQLQDQFQKGTLNHDEFMTTVQNSLDQVQNEVKTSAGQMRFKQMAAGSQYDFSQEAQAKQAHLAGAQAVANTQMASDSRTSFVMGEPQRFQSTLEEQNKSIDDMVATKGLPATLAPELKRQYMDKLAAGALRGQMQYDPAGTRKDLDSGKWDKYLSEQTKYRMDIEINRAENAQRIKDERLKKIQDDAASAKQEAAKEGMLQKLYRNNGLSTDEVLQNHDIDEQSKEHMLSLIEKRTTEKVSTDNPMMRHLMEQIYLPAGDPRKQINSQDDLNKYYINGSINHEGLRILRGEFSGKGTIQGDADNQLSKNFYQMMYQQIAKPDPMTKIPDPDGAKAYQIWLADSLQKKQDAMMKGKKAEDLFNPKSPYYLGNNVSQFQRTPEEIMKAQIDKMTRESGMPSPTPAPPPVEDTVSVTSPAGKTGRIPKASIQKYKALGYRFN